VTAKWWWRQSDGGHVYVIRRNDRPATWRALDRPAKSEADALAIARGMALAEAEGRLRP